MTNEISSIERETRQYWYADGFVEVAIGLLFVLVGAAIYAQHYFSDNPMWLIISVIGMTVLIAGGSYGVSWLVKTLKERVTYPRTGYVEYDATPNPTIKRIVLAFPILIGIAILFLPDAFNVVGSAIGLLLAIILAFFAYQSGTWRFTVASMIAIGGVVMTTYFTLNDANSAALVFVSVGSFLLLSGIIVAMRYLQDNPPQDDAP